jgi:hypothetical protein
VDRTNNSSKEMDFDDVVCLSLSCFFHGFFSVRKKSAFDEKKFEHF